MKIKLGLTLRFTNDYYYIKERYLKYLSKLNYEIIFLSIYNISLIPLCDMFVISGGGDCHPFLYNQKIKAKLNIYKDEDYLDLEILKHAVKYHKKVLGICRGMQIINVFFNGSLHQDIPNHQNTTHLAKYANKEIKINSYHHQSIDKLGDHLKVFLTSNDLTIEGIYHTKYDIVGVQYHPEFQETSFDYIFLLFLISS